MSEPFLKIAAGEYHDPHSVLGPHAVENGIRYTAYLPSTQWVRIAAGATLERVTDSDFYSALLPSGSITEHPQLIRKPSNGPAITYYDPYSFAPTLSSDALASVANGANSEAWRTLGAHTASYDGIDGVRFAVWAPNASRVSLVGPFCDWDGRILPMRVMGQSGVWELFVPGLALGTVYKYEIRARESGAVFLKSDPYAQAMELRPNNASVVTDPSFHWGDAQWLQLRAGRDWLRTPMSIYEVHLGSWQRHADGSFLSYDELADALIPYAKRLGFTHLELLPITEHPLDDSWGYQTTGYFAATSRFGEPAGLKRFVDRCHQAGLGVLLDWVPAHFPRDEHGLANFDGSALYEYADPRKGSHKEWGTLVFNYARHEVRSFLLSSARYWLDEFHFDGLRVDAVAAMLYLDYGREGDFTPNQHGGREHLEAIDFIRDLNRITHACAPGSVVIAEESTAWPMVSHPTEHGGLGFSMKWNMGWMHDTLSYFTEDPLYRRYHHHKLTFGMMYAFSENFVLPLSHDEVVHLKRSLLGKMPGDRWQQLASLRLLYLYMWTLPGKKLLFMGGEFAHPWEWDFHVALPWSLVEHAEHRGMQDCIRDLNALYISEPALHQTDFDSRGFKWIDCNDDAQSTLSYHRFAPGRTVTVALNFTPVPRLDHSVVVAEPGEYIVLFNSDSLHYGGSNTGSTRISTVASGLHGELHTLLVTLPPLGGLIICKV